MDLLLIFIYETKRGKDGSGVQWKSIVLKRNNLNSTRILVTYNFTPNLKDVIKLKCCKWQKYVHDFPSRSDKKYKDASNAIRVFDDILQFGAHLLVLIPTWLNVAMTWKINPA